MALIGDWIPPRRSAGSRPLDYGPIRACPTERRALRNTLVVFQPNWILLGEGVEEDQLSRLLTVVHEAVPGARLAALGSDHDVDRCLRWVHRGASVYLASITPLPRLLATLQISQKLDIAIVDACFSRQMLLHQARFEADLLEGRSQLTTRELEVLRLMRHGLRNSDIASALTLSESTVEFHVSNILSKLGATNRTEAAERALILNL